MLQEETPYINQALSQKFGLSANSGLIPTVGPLGGPRLRQLDNGVFKLCG